MVAVIRDAAQRFWNRVNGPWCDDRLDPYEDCWQWMGATTRSRPPRVKLVKAWKRYGRFHWPLPGVRKHLVNAHRAALLLTVGDPPDEAMVAAHRCDNSLCVHPGHLEWQTQQQNIAEAVARGRLTRVRDARGSRWASTGSAT